MAAFPLESLPLTAEVKVLAERYIGEKIIPEKERNDAIHIADKTGSQGNQCFDGV